MQLFEAIPEFDEVRRTRSRADGGIDLVAVNTTPFVGGRVAIQAKRYATHHKVDIAAVREIAGSISQREFNKGIIITTSDFTKAAGRRPHGSASSYTNASGCYGCYATTCTASSMSSTRNVVNHRSKSRRMDSSITSSLSTAAFYGARSTTSHAADRVERHGAARDIGHAHIVSRQP